MMFPRILRLLPEASPSTAAIKQRIEACSVSEEDLIASTQCFVLACDLPRLEAFVNAVVPELDAMQVAMLCGALLRLHKGGGHTEGEKMFNDHIHGHVVLHPLCIKIIDTPQFQRLRDISQLGGVNFVFAGAANKRFDHSIGVSQLAKRLVTQLDERQPELGITTQDILCVEIAGLIHDLGHGPFSHMYESMFLRDKLGVSFDHEHASVGIFDILIEENDLMPHFTRYGLTAADIHFIKELVLGSVEDAHKIEGFAWAGRGVKTFLYDIVANKRNGIDVDKLDYFARDGNLLNIANTLDIDRIMLLARVYEVFPPTQQGSGSQPQEDSAASGQLQICFKLNEAWNIHELFQLRYNLHKRAYQHVVVGAVELMIAEAFALAAPYLSFEGKGGAARRLSECHEDLHAYWKLGEYVLKLIEFSSLPEMKPARDMVLRIRKRDLFGFVDQRVLAERDCHIFRNEGLRRDLRRDLIGILREAGVAAEEVADNDVLHKIVKISYGKGSLNPLQETTFYDVDKVHKTLDGRQRPSLVVLGKVDSSSLGRVLPKEFEDTSIRVYCRHKRQREQLKDAFAKWCKQYCPATNPPMTPLKDRKRDFDEMSSNY